MTHRTLNESVIRRYFLLNLAFDQIDEIMKRYFKKYNNNYEKEIANCVLIL